MPGYPSYTPIPTFSGGTVSNRPASADGIVQIFDGANAGTHTITFSQAVLNPVLAICKSASIERAQRRTTPSNQGETEAQARRSAARRRLRELVQQLGRQHLGRDRALERRARQARDLVVQVLVDLAGGRMRAQDRLQRRGRPPARSTRT